MKATLAALWLLFAPALPALDANAGPGALEINNDCVAVGCFSGDAAGYPVTITRPGSYVLTSDLSAPGNNTVDAVQIQASAVDFDLNGHSIDGGGTCTGTPVTACSGSLGRDGVYANADYVTPLAVHIHNGSIHGFASDGIHVVAGDGTLIEHVSSYENGAAGLSMGGTASVEPTARIRDSAFSRNKGSGVDGVAFAATMVITGSTAAGNGTFGVEGISRTVLTDDGIIDNLNGGAFSTSLLIVGRNAFVGNNSGGTQYGTNGQGFAIGVNVCSDHSGGSCP